MLNLSVRIMKVVLLKVIVILHYQINFADSPQFFRLVTLASPLVIGTFSSMRLEIGKPAKIERHFSDKGYSATFYSIKSF